MSQLNPQIHLKSVVPIIIVPIQVYLGGLCQDLKFENIAAAASAG